MAAPGYPDMAQVADAVGIHIPALSTVILGLGALFAAILSLSVAAELVRQAITGEKPLPRIDASMLGGAWQLEDASQQEATGSEPLFDSLELPAIDASMLDDYSGIDHPDDLPGGRYQF